MDFVARSPVVAVAGATGAVGVEMLKCLEKRNFPLSSLKLLASKRSAGTTMRFRGEDLPVTELTEQSFAGVDIALFSAGGSISKAFAPAVAAAGAVMIDNSSAFRMNPDVPLVVPEINPQAAAQHKGIIANPNCSTIIAAVPLWPLHRKNRIKRLIASTYQAASGAGWAAMEELKNATRAALDGKPFTQTIIPHPYAFNLFSHNTTVDPVTLANEEEGKLIKETRKIFGDAEIRISATCVRVPVLRAHCEALTVEFERPMSREEATAILSDAPGVRIVDDIAANHFPMPNEASEQDDVLVGRIRADMSDPSGHSLQLFVSGDQLLKGAALNAVQIAELLH
ncbi:Aspartate-semialdehyde dehydrogenase [Alphaproteobacteria bacterium SO-S41]|nr:Aspartate-semialdehyde dehydrogenase [Alphaproteobacteria bacterium SO-S41]